MPTTSARWLRRPIMRQGCCCLAASGDLPAVGTAHDGALGIEACHTFERLPSGHGLVDRFIETQVVRMEREVPIGSTRRDGNSSRRAVSPWAS
jgi:hypothetical protein